MPPHLFGCGSAALWFAFSVPSMSCPMWGRLSSRPWPLYPPLSLPPKRVPRRGGPACPRLLLRSPCPSMLSKSRRRQVRNPPGLPCRRSRRQSDTISSCTGVPSANRRQDWRRGPHDCALHLQPPSRVGADRRVRPLSSNLSVLRVLCGLPSPCPLWFAFSVPSPPPVTTFPKSFSLSFSTTSHLPLLSPLAPLLYVESERCG